MDDNGIRFDFPYCTACQRQTAKVFFKVVVWNYALVAVVRDRLNDGLFLYNRNHV